MRATIERWRARLPFAIALAVLLLPALATARPGGGQGFSGGGSSGGSSGGSGGGGGGGGSGGELGLFELIELIYYLVLLIIEYPWLVLVLLAAGVLYGVGTWAWGHVEAWSTAPTGTRTVPSGGARRVLAGLDEDFSLPVFEDFVQALYTRVHTARGGGKLEELAPWVADPARAALAGRGSFARVEGIVIGSMQLVSAEAPRPTGQRAQATLRFEANYTEVDASGRGHGLYVVERWTFERRAGAKSRPPERARAFDCPNCGAPETSRDTLANRCRACGERLVPGAFDWCVARVELERWQPVPPALGAHAEEQGTRAPTVVVEGAEARLGELSALAGASFGWDGFTARVRLAFDEINAGWSTRAWERARPFVSDPMFQTQRYFLEAYARAGVRNVVERAQVERVELSNAERDRHYLAITARVFARGFDYTLDERTGAVKSGSRTAERRWTEYWTFVRSVRATGGPRADKQCPNCGAPLAFEMSGQCRHCNAHVTSGEFDWVLARIEQDDAYAG